MIHVLNLLKRKIGLVGLIAAVTMSATAVVGAAGASAANPEFSKFGVCQKAPAGFPAFAKGSLWTYSNSACSTVAAPTAAFALGSGAWGFSPFYSESGAGTLETVAGRRIECKHDYDIGELITSREDRAIVKFTECTATTPFGTANCHSIKPGAPEGAAGEIITNVLKSKLVWANAAETEAGIALEPKTAALFTEIFCEGGGAKQTLRVRGSVVGVITPFKVSTKSYTLTFTQNTGVQAPTGYYEGGNFVSDKLETEGSAPFLQGETFAYEQSGEQDTSPETTAETGEIK